MEYYFEEIKVGEPYLDGGIFRVSAVQSSDLVKCSYQGRVMLNGNFVDADGEITLPFRDGEGKSKLSKRIRKNLAIRINSHNI